MFRLLPGILRNRAPAGGFWESRAEEKTGTACRPLRVIRACWMAGVMTVFWWGQVRGWSRPTRRGLGERVGWRGGCAFLFGIPVLILIYILYILIRILIDILFLIVFRVHSLIRCGRACPGFELPGNSGIGVASRVVVVDGREGAEEEAVDESEDGGAASGDAVSGEEAVDIGEGKVDALGGLKILGSGQQIVREILISICFCWAR